MYANRNGEGTDGAIWHMSVNTSNSPDTIYAVGVFDSVSETSQAQYCSIGLWDGKHLAKVGQGLCPRGAEQHAMHIQSSVVGGDGRLFVGGNFISRVWDGKEFVDAVNVAVYEDGTQQWLPLKGGILRYEPPKGSSADTKIDSLTWDDVNKRLFIGGLINRLDKEHISPGLAIWTEKEGLHSFPTKGLYQAGGDGEAMALTFESRSQSLFVAGLFDSIGGIECQSVAVWNSYMNEWRCLNDQNYMIMTVTTMSLQNDILFLAGWASPSSTWMGSTLYESPYAIAVLDVAGYIEGVIINVTNTHRSDHDVYDHHYYYSSLNRPKRSRAQVAAIDFTQKVVKSRDIYSKKFRRTLRVLTTDDDDHDAHDDDDDGMDHHHHHAPRNRSGQNPWEPHWGWLPGYTGGNGPILAIVSGAGDSDNSLYIGGAFNTYGSVVEWSVETENGTNVISLGSFNAVQGLVSSLVMAKMRFPDLPFQNPTTQPTYEPILAQSDDKWLILISCVLSGIVLGVGFAVGCSSKGYSKIKDFDSQMTGITLKTLSLEGDGIDLKSSFDRAMRARHMTSQETLLMVNPKEVILFKIIGEGSFGRVWSGQWRNNSVAVKEFVFAQAAVAGGSLQRHNIVEEIVGEAGIMACLKHPKILQLYGCSLTMQAIWIVSELCTRGSLRMLLNDKKMNLPLIKKVSICLDIADGMHYLHSRTPTLIHRDLKSHNIFVAEPSPGNFVAKIGDWGSARAVQLSGSQSHTHGVGTACWLAPEVINHARSSKKSDVYAFGIVLWEVYTRQEVHEGLSAAQIIAKVAHEGLRPKIPLGCPLQNIMSDCWKQDPHDRPHFNVVVTALSEMYEQVSDRMKSIPMTSKDDSFVINRANKKPHRNKNLTTPGVQKYALPVIMEGSEDKTNVDYGALVSTRRHASGENVKYDIAEGNIDEERDLVHRSTVMCKTTLEGNSDSTEQTKREGPGGTLCGLGDDEKEDMLVSDIGDEKLALLAKDASSQPLRSAGELPTPPTHMFTASAASKSSNLSQADQGDR